MMKQDVEKLQPYGYDVYFVIAHLGPNGMIGYLHVPSGACVPLSQGATIYNDFDSAKKATQNIEYEGETLFIVPLTIKEFGFPNVENLRNEEPKPQEIHCVLRGEDIDKALQSYEKILKRREQRAKGERETTSRDTTLGSPSQVIPVPDFQKEQEAILKASEEKLASDGYVETEEGVWSKPSVF